MLKAPLLIDSFKSGLEEALKNVLQGTILCLQGNGLDDLVVFSSSNFYGPFHSSLQCMKSQQLSSWEVRKRGTAVSAVLLPHLPVLLWGYKSVGERQTCACYTSSPPQIQGDSFPKLILTVLILTLPSLLF